MWGGGTYAKFLHINTVHWPVCLQTLYKRCKLMLRKAKEDVNSYKQDDRYKMFVLSCCKYVNI